MKDKKSSRKISVNGLNWWVRKGHKGLWRKFVAGVMYTSSGDGSGIPSENSAEIAARNIAEKIAARQNRTAAPDMSGVEILNDDYRLSPAPVSPPVPPPAPRRFIAPLPAGTPEPAFNIAAEVQNFIEHERRRWQAKEITTHTLCCVEQEAGHFRKWIEAYNIRHIGERECDDYRLFQVGIKNGGRRKESTIRKRLYMTKRVVKWLYENHVLEFLPRNIDTVFVLKPDKQSKRERARAESTDKPVFSVEQLRQIFAACSERTRLYMLLAMNIGAYYSDIAELRHEEIKDGYIVRGRTKTGETGKWKLWGITKTYLAKFATAPGQYPATDGYGSYLLRHKDGGELYGYTKRAGSWKTHRTCHIEAPFFDVLEKLGITVGTFRQLRHTTANLVQSVGGTDVAKLYLANSKETIAEKHYLNSMYEKLDAALDTVEKNLSLEG